MGDLQKLTKLVIDFRDARDWKQFHNPKRKLKDNPIELNRLVRNIYKILLTRGMKGCYVYFEDREVKRYFRSRMKPL